MRLVLRVLGTWLLGVAVIFVIVDGTKSLSANDIVTTGFGDLWTSFHPESLDTVRAFISTRLLGSVLDPAITALLAFPAFAVIGIPALILAVLGRSRRSRRFMSQDSI